MSGGWVGGDRQIYRCIDRYIERERDYRQRDGWVIDSEIYVNTPHMEEGIIPKSIFLHVTG